MKWNKTTDQILRVAQYLAAAQRVVPSIELAGFLGSTRQTVIQNAAMMQSAGLVGILSGPSGGYYFAKDPKTTTLYDVLVASEKPSFFPKQEAWSHSEETIHLTYSFLQNAIDCIFKNVLVSDIAFGGIASIHAAKLKAFNELIFLLSGIQIKETRISADLEQGEKPA